jgi:hypothetical protein
MDDRRPKSQNLRVAFLALALATCATAAAGETAELGRHCEEALAKAAAPADKEWCFGVVADPHIYMYAWSDLGLARCLRGWSAAKARFGMVVGDLGTGENLQADGPAAPGSQPIRTKQTDKFAKTISSATDCPPVFLSMGNHEMDGDGKRSWLEAMFPGSTPRIEGNGNDRYFYYSFNYRGCHFVCLDANRTVDKKQQLGMLPEEELTWLEQDLAANRGKLTFVFLHEPIEQHGYLRDIQLSWDEP